MPLGINLETILAHALNIIVLFFTLRFLLYKPVKKFMDERANSYTQREEDVKNSEKSATELKEKYEFQMHDSKNEAEKIILDSRKDANKRAEEIINQASEHSKTIIEQTRKDIVEERANAKIAMREEVADLAIGIANRVLEREVSAEDNKHIIDSFLNKKRIG